MRFSPGKSAFLILALTLACAAPQLRARKKQTPADSGSNELATSEQRRAAHALNRLTFGPRPGDVQQVAAMGVDAWIDLQLHPEKIPDAALDSRLAPFRTLRMTARHMVEEFPDNQMIRQVKDGKKPMPFDPAERAVFQVQIARMEEKQERKERKAEAAAPQVATAAKLGPELPPASDTAKTAEEIAAAAKADSDSASNANSDSGSMTSSMNSSMSAMRATSEDRSQSANAESKTAVDDPEARRREQRLYADLEVQQLIDLPPDQRYKKIMSMSADEQLAFADSLRGAKGQEFLTGLDPKQKETLLAMNNPESVVVDELVQAKLLRAIYSERQLQEVMTDFWFNHFNVFMNKGADRVLVTSYEQDVIRPRALGKFEDLLVATAKSPAMLFYLDSWMSVGPDSMQGLGIPAHPGAGGPYRYPRQNPNANPNAKRRQNSGLNENYGRELLELHTLSVNGGYTQRDVTEVAKVFTGWTIDKPNQGGDFKYDPRMHEPGPKFVLGHKIKPKGEDEGREVLHMLATSPQTAHFICLKLAQRFVSDDPPPALVDRMAKTFHKKKGDIREVLRTLFHSPEFWAADTYRAKVKTPFEFVASAVRATGADVEDAMPLARQLNTMGMPLYGAQPPTGYSMKAETWVSSSALLNRMNFALALTAGRIRGVKVDAARLAGSVSGSPGEVPPQPEDAALMLNTMEAKLLAADVSKQTNDSILAQLAPPAEAAKANQPDDEYQKQREKQGWKHASKSPAQRPPNADMIAGLLLGSPEFQRR